MSYQNRGISLAACGARVAAAAALPLFTPYPGLPPRANFISPRCGWCLAIQPADSAGGYLSPAEAGFEQHKLTAHRHDQGRALTHVLQASCFFAACEESWNSGLTCDPPSRALRLSLACVALRLREPAPGIAASAGVLSATSPRSGGRLRPAAHAARVRAAC